MRRMLSSLPRYIATVETTKHRVFQFLDADILPDNMLINVASDDALVLGVLSSRVHVAWALAAGGRLGVGNDPRYNKTRCFETFPFPVLEPATADRISQLAEELDAFRKARQAAHESVTLTGMYNVLDKLRREEPLNAKDKALHEQALVGVLRTLHDDLDAAVLEAYGWQDLGPVPWSDDEARQAWTERLLERLVDLNTRRAAEEARGTIRWLRPAFQNPTAPTAEPQSAIELVGGANAPETEDEAVAPIAAAPAARLPWPADLPEPAASPEPLSDEVSFASSPPAVLDAVVPLLLLFVSELSPPVLPHATRLTIMVLASNAEITFFFIWCPPCDLRSFCVLRCCFCPGLRRIHCF
jgi:hypothetical protein